MNDMSTLVSDDSSNKATRDGSDKRAGTPGTGPARACGVPTDAYYIAVRYTSNAVLRAQCGCNS